MTIPAAGSMTSRSPSRGLDLEGGPRSDGSPLRGAGVRPTSRSGGFDYDSAMSRITNSSVESDRGEVFLGLPARSAYAITVTHVSYAPATVKAS